VGMEKARSRRKAISVRARALKFVSTLWYDVPYCFKIMVYGSVSCWWWGGLE
jgi:hypothetical protein